MKINETIRKYRKEQNLTQEQIANNLGVSAPAVNKWENGISYPDIELLAPLARLLKIDIDTLLSFREELTEQEIGQFINQLAKEISAVGFEACYRQVKKKIREFPNCYKLILWSAQILNAYLTMQFKDKDIEVKDIEVKEHYSNQINEWFKAVAFCNDPELAKAAQISLAQNLMNDKKFAEAQSILDKIPAVGFDKRTTQVQLFVGQEKYEDAFKIQDQMLYQQASGICNTLEHTISILCKDNEYDQALYFAEILDQVSNTFELGSYIGDSTYFLIYMEMKNADKTIEYLEKMFSGFYSMRDAKKSRLYTHMEFKKNDGIKDMKAMLVKNIDTQEELNFIRDNPRYIELIQKIKGQMV